MAAPTMAPVLNPVTVLGSTSAGVATKVLVDANGALVQGVSAGQNSFSARVSITRPSNTNTYGAGDVVGVTGEDEAREYLDGWRIAVSLPELDKSLEGLEVAVDRSEADKSGAPFVLVSVYSPDELAALTFSPVFAGSRAHDRVKAVRDDIEAKPLEKAGKAEAMFAAL